MLTCLMLTPPPPLQLVHMGYKLVSIPYWEWIEIRAVPETLREYLRRKLGA